MTHRSNPAKRRTGNRASLMAFALVAVAIAAISGGCVLDHDPRNDASRVQPTELVRAA